MFRAEIEQGRGDANQFEQNGGQRRGAEALKETHEWCCASSF